jgi:hypothetical protein
LELLIQRRISRKKLGSEAVNRKIVERPYQHRAIRNTVTGLNLDNFLVRQRRRAVERNIASRKYGLRLTTRSARNWSKRLRHCLPKEVSERRKQSGSTF